VVGGEFRTGSKLDDLGKPRLAMRGLLGGLGELGALRVLQNRKVAEGVIGGGTKELRSLVAVEADHGGRG